MNSRYNTYAGGVVPHPPRFVFLNNTPEFDMLHFPSKLQKNGPSGAPRRSTDLNATQHKTSSYPILSEIEDELHDARRVYSHGQEEDLRSALIMVIDRVVQLVSLFLFIVRSILL